MGFFKVIFGESQSHDIYISDVINVSGTEPTGVTAFIDMTVMLVENQFTREAVGYPVLSSMSRMVNKR